jgi:hypothetical protein
MIRVRASRWLSRWLLGRDVMLCAIADAYRWRARTALDMLFFWDRPHCERAADWESFRGRDKDFIDTARRSGWL